MNSAINHREENQETTALSVNMEAAKEIARQLRLRDMGGIIVVDFIDMKNPDNKKLIYKIMKDEMEDDKAKSTVLPLSKFGLMQITRERVRPQMNIATKEVCPACNGTGKITASILVSDLIEKNIEHLLVKPNEKHLVLAGTIPAAYFTQGLISRECPGSDLQALGKMVRIPIASVIQILNKEGRDPVT